MAKSRNTSRSAKKSTRVSSRRGAAVHGLDHDFILLAGGGFILLILILMTLFY